MTLAKAARILALGIVKPAAHAEPTGKTRRVKMELSEIRRSLLNRLLLLEQKVAELEARIKKLEEGRKRK